MKKIMFLTMAIIALVFSSCSSEHEEDLIGIWQVENNIPVDQSLGTMFVESKCYWIFSKDNTFEVSGNIFDENMTSVGKGTFLIKNDNIIITINGISTSYLITEKNKNNFAILVKTPKSSTSEACDFIRYFLRASTKEI